jgi:uncharacterized membrane protein YqjE
MADSSSQAQGPGARGAESVIELVRGVLQDLPGLIGDRVELASLELRRAGEALVRITVLVVAAAILGVTAWLAVWFLLGSLLVQAGAHPLVALALAIVLNLGVAAWALRRARVLLGRLGLPATRRHLTFAAPSPPPQPPSHERPAEPQPL